MAFANSGASITSSDVGEQKPMKRIIILGMGRSGTSFLTGCLAKCGVYVDEVSDKFEHSQSRGINETILQEYYGARHGLPYGNLPAEEIFLPETWHNKVREFVSYMDERARVAGAMKFWTFKDPRTTVLHSIWIDHFDVLVSIFRRPEQVVESFLARKWITGWRRKRIALDYWIRFNTSLLEVWKHWHSTKPTFVMDYNADIQIQLINLCNRLELPLSNDAQNYYESERNHFSKATALNHRRAIEVYQSLREIRNLL
jgi:hypothetical protein